ncbi:MAG: hypothetical protein IIC50_20540 [Planctomycetes bacterium]|nr:hypothetical protein [Planctomycetota bacterium]
MTSRKYWPALMISVLLFAARSHGAVMLPGLETSRLDQKLKGLVLLEELNCTACHESRSSFAATSKRAPRLSGVGSRLNPYYLEKYIQAPHDINPGGTMPDVMAHLDVQEKKQAAEAITHFLVSLNKGPDFGLESPDTVAAELGETLFHSVGCVACHSPRNEKGEELLKEASVPLGALEQKYNVTSLIDFIRRPHDTRPSGRMPDMRLQSRDVERIAHYLLRETRVPGRLRYTVLRGRVWEGLDAEVEKERSGHTEDFDLMNFDTLNKNSALDFEGFLRIGKEGVYRFFLEMNGGTLWIDDKEVVNLIPSNRRGVKKVSGNARLEAGWNKIRFTYIHAGKEPRLSFEMEGDSFKRQAIPSSLLSISKTPIEPYKPYPVRGILVETGEHYFSKLGCGKCHDDIKVDSGGSIALSELNAAKGCLSGRKGPWPNYNLNDEQHKLLTAVLPRIETMQLSDAETVNKTLVTFNCIACHERVGLGGVMPERDHYFVGAKPELGNQGRIPPPLTHVGAKLNKAWLREVMLRGGRQRFYLNASMPLFGEMNVGHLVDLFEKVDALEEVSIPEVSNVKAFRNAGHEMVGTDGFSCIACHDFNGQKSGGAGALELIHTTQRIKKNWFHLYMLQPARFHQTVIMPTYWPDGTSLRPDVLGGDTGKQIEALWVYLKDGSRARNPKGLSRQSSELRVADVAVMCRGRGPAGYRGIAVGYPEGVSLAFDSEQMNLRFLWKGDFANINHGSWSVRGRDRIPFPTGIPFHRLGSMEDNWPYKRKSDYLFPHDHGYQYRGYFLDEHKRPTFMYRYGDIKVEDFFEDLLDESGKVYFKRTFSFESQRAQEQFYFRAASGNVIVEKPDNTYLIDGLTLRIVSAHQGIIREGEPRELLISLALPAGKSNLIMEYRW